MLTKDIDKLKEKSKNLDKSKDSRLKKSIDKKLKILENNKTIKK